MNLTRVKAIFIQEIFLTLRSVEMLMDVFVFPFVNLLIFGFLSLYLNGNNNPLAAKFVLLGMLLWQIIWIVQYAVCLGSLFNIWSRNLSNLFVSPLKLREYIFAHTLSGVIKSVIVIVLSSLLTYFAFDFNILSIGIVQLLIIFIQFILFAFSMGIFFLGLIFRFGTRIQAFSWGIIPIFQPLCAAFFPLEVLPLPLQYVARLFPPTYVFEAARYSIVNNSINWQLHSIALIINLVYFTISIILFRQMFKKSKDTGQFARNEG